MATGRIDSEGVCTEPAEGGLGADRTTVVGLTA
ncbi:hypothetical protein SAMN05216371_5734 [Streptomyces sp. TLI_053]|nr:hypothetical protein SAMN05216371_5734 [Streptomyces sp. TLI_053]